MLVGCFLSGPNSDLFERLVAAVEAEGCGMESLTDLGAFQASTGSGRYALAIFRHGQPEDSILDCLRDLRHHAPAVPIVVVSATLLPAAGRVAMLDAGADEVLDGALPLPEAIARVRAALRRAKPSGVAPTALPVLAGWRLSPAIRQMESPEGGSHRLTAAEFDLLRLLVAASGEAVDRDAISRHALRRPWCPEDRAVDGLVKRLRRKIGPDTIQTSRGQGYALTINVHSI